MLTEAKTAELVENAWDMRLRVTEETFEKHLGMLKEMPDNHLFPAWHDSDAYDGSPTLPLICALHTALDTPYHVAATGMLPDDFKALDAQVEAYIRSAVRGHGNQTRSLIAQREELIEALQDHGIGEDEDSVRELIDAIDQSIETAKLTAKNTPRSRAS